MESQRRAEESMSILECGERLATWAVEDAGKFADIERNLGRILNQRAGEQTTRMAMTTIANALTFHATVVGVHGIPPVAQLRDDPRHTLQTALLETWRRILREVNYLPIFAVASSLLAPIRAATCRAECSRT